MMTKTYDRQTAKLIARIAENLPDMSGTIMQGWIENPRRLQQFLTGLNVTPAPKRLRKFVDNLCIPATAGVRTIAESANVFAWIDPAFQRYGPSPAPRGSTQVTVFEMVRDGTFADIFGETGRDLDELCFSQDQIVSFVEQCTQGLHSGGHGNFFLFKVKDDYSVARVFRRSGGWCVSAGVFTNDSWNARSRHHVIFPQVVA